MKTLQKVPLEFVEVEYIPEILQFGKLYYSKKYNTCNHLCPCGCGSQTPLPIKEGEWRLSVTDGKVTIAPSVQHRYDCKSHYIITNGLANIVNQPIPKEQWSKEETTHAPGSCPL